MAWTAVGADRNDTMPGNDLEMPRRRLREAFGLVRALVRHHKRLFFTAVGGAAVFAACTVLSAAIVRLITDDLIAPRFNNGSVSKSRVLIVLGALVLVGFVRAAAVDRKSTRLNSSHG